MASETINTTSTQTTSFKFPDDFDGDDYSKTYSTFPPGLQIKYSVRPANKLGCEGQGIFVDEKVLQGHLVWRYVSSVNVDEYDGERAARHLETLSAEDAKDFLDLTYGIHGRIALILDDGRFMNHSTRPNCITNMRTGNTFALRDIEVGEMLSEDYGRFEHPPFLYPLLVKYNCAPTYYTLPPEFTSSISADLLTRPAEEMK